MKVRVTNCVATTNLLDWCWCLSHHSQYGQSLPVPAHPLHLRLTCHGQGTLGEGENKELEFGRSDQEHMKPEHCCSPTCLWNTATHACVADLESSKLRPSDRGDPTLCTHKHFLQVPAKFTALTVAHWQPSRTFMSMIIEKYSYSSKCFLEKKTWEEKPQKYLVLHGWVDLMLWAERHNGVQKELISYI